MRKIASLSDLADGSITKATVDGEDIVIVRDGSLVAAFAATCPHAGAPFEDGVVCDHRLVCPWHKSMFSVGDGSILEPPSLDPLRRYATRVDGDDVLVSADPIASPPQPERIEDRRVVILGSGAGGTASAFALREFGFTGEILMIGNEVSRPYDRTVLSKFVLNDMDPADIPPLRRDQDWTDQRIDRREATISRVDARERRVWLADGQVVDYDAAILATGATPNIPKLPGVNLRGVFPLRDRGQAAAIAGRAAAGSEGVIIGASFIGLEAASALRERGVKVTVVAPEEIPFARQFGPEIGTMFHNLHQAHGVVFHLGTKVERIAGTDTVDAVVLEGGERIAADFVLLGVGVTPATGFVDGVRKSKDGGIIVDDMLRAADALHVVGDTACFPVGDGHVRIEHWRVAQQHARVAAENIAGTERHYRAVPYFWTYHFGERFEYLGHAEHWDSVHVEGDLDSQRFVALQVEDGVVRGVVACRRERTTAILIERMRQKLEVSEAIQLIRQMAER